MRTEGKYDSDSFNANDDASVWNDNFNFYNYK